MAHSRLWEERFGEPTFTSLSTSDADPHLYKLFPSLLGVRRPRKDVPSRQTCFLKQISPNTSSWKMSSSATWHQSRAFSLGAYLLLSNSPSNFLMAMLGRYLFECFWKWLHTSQAPTELRNPSSVSHVPSENSPRPLQAAYMASVCPPGSK